MRRSPLGSPAGADLISKVCMALAQTSGLRAVRTAGLDKVFAICEQWLIAEINYQSDRVFVRHILTHGEYDRGRWKK